MALKALLADYDPRSIDRISEVLLRLGLQILLARDGQAALSEFLVSRPDITLIQNPLPRVDGLEVCRRIKESHAGADSRVVLLGTRLRRTVLLGTRCDAFLAKPYTSQSLAETVERLLGLGHGAPSVSL